MSQTETLNDFPTVIAQETLTLMLGQVVTMGTCCLLTLIGEKYVCLKYEILSRRKKIILNVTC